MSLVWMILSEPLSHYRIFAPAFFSRFFSPFVCLQRRLSCCVWIWLCLSELNIRVFLLKVWLSPSIYIIPIHWIEMPQVSLFNGNSLVLSCLSASPQVNPGRPGIFWRNCDSSVTVKSIHLRVITIQNGKYLMKLMTKDWVSLKSVSWWMEFLTIIANLPQVIAETKFLGIHFVDMDYVQKSIWIVLLQIGWVRDHIF